MRPLTKEYYTDHKDQYTPYGNAKVDLFKAIGAYCSYCERQGHFSALSVEHIHDKSKHSDLENDWDNFLLACINCNSIKGTKEVDFEKMFFPTNDDTFSIFRLLDGGFIQIHPDLPDLDSVKAKRLLDLVGVNRYPGITGYSPKDKRWEERKSVWELAVRYLRKYEENLVDEETLLDLAKSKGFWSVWMTVFKDQKEFVKKLIQSFKGTKQDYFKQILG